MTCGNIKIKISAVYRELQKGSYMDVFIKRDIGFYKRKSHYGLCLLWSVAGMRLQKCNVYTGHVKQHKVDLNGDHELNALIDLL